MAIADQARVANGESVLNTTSPQQVQTILYSNPTDFHDITSGTSTGRPEYSAGTGYDYVTGMGTPIANLVVSSLVGAPAAPHDKLVAHRDVGRDGRYRVQGHGDSRDLERSHRHQLHRHDPLHQQRCPGGSAGELCFPCERRRNRHVLGDSQDGRLPVDHGDGYVELADHRHGLGNQRQPGRGRQFILSGLSSSATVGVAQSLTVTAEDPYGNVATTYVGTVQFTSSDSAATLPASTTFTTANAGVRAFSITFGTAGTQTVTVTDSTQEYHRHAVGHLGHTGRTDRLTATAASSSQINLSWTAPKGGHRLPRPGKPQRQFRLDPDHHHFGEPAIRIPA